jgi:hypothetical protein
MAYASSTLSLNDKPAADHTTWSNDFRRLVTDAHSTSNQITSVLSLLSSCLSNGQALPPYLEMPQPYAFVRRLESIDKNILSVRHIGEPEYSAFAVLQICGGSVTADLEKLVKYVSRPFPFLVFINADAMADMYEPWLARSTSHSMR